MANYDLGTAQGKIELQYDDNGAVTGFTTDMDKIEKKGKSAGDVMKGASTKMLLAGGAMAAGLGMAVKTAADFETRISAIGAVSGATAPQLEQIRQKALQLGKDTQFSASESASAMEELVKAGLTVDDVLNGAADATVALAAAGSVDMPTAATISANAMNQFNLQAKDMVGVVDQIAGAANASAIDVTDFGMSLTQVGAVANLAGVSFEDTATAIALMGNAGIKGSDAGTSLKSMFARLQPTTDKTATIFKDLGLITEDGSNKFYDAQGNLKGLADVSGILQNALKGQTKQQQQATLQTLFGSDAIRAAAILAKNGSKGFDSMAKSMGKVSAADVAAKRMDNFNGSLEQLKGSLETAAIVIGSALIPPIRTLVDGITGLVNKFLNLNPNVQKFVGYAAVAVTALLLLAGAFIKVWFGVGKMITNMKIIVAAVKSWTIWSKLAAAATKIWTAIQAAWNAVMSLNPIVLIVLAIIALVAILVLAYKKSETFRNFVNAAWESIWNTIGPIVKAIVSAVQAAWDWIVQASKAAWEWVYDYIVTPLKDVLGYVLGALKQIWGFIKFWFNLMVLEVKAAMAVLSVIFRAAWAVIKTVVIPVLKLIWEGIKFYFGLMKSFITTVLRVIGTVVKTGFKVIWTVAKTVWKAIWAVIKWAWDLISGAVKAGVHFVISVWNTIRGIVNTVRSIWQAVVDTIKEKVDAIIDKVRSIKDRIFSFFSGAKDWLLDAGKNIIQGLIDGIGTMFNALKDKLSFVTDLIPDWKGPPAKDKKLLYGSGKLIMQGFQKGLEDQFKPLEGQFAGMTASIPGLAGTNVKNNISVLPAPVQVKSPTTINMYSYGDQTQTAIDQNANKLRDLIYEGIVR